MSHVAALRAFFSRVDPRALGPADAQAAVGAVCADAGFRPFLDASIAARVFAPEYGADFARADALDALASCRLLRGALNLPLGRFFTVLARIAPIFAATPAPWAALARRVEADARFAAVRLADFLTHRLADPRARAEYADLVARLVVEDPHAIYPTSSYRESDGGIESAPDGGRVEAVMSLRTYASIAMADRVLDVENAELRDLYRPFGRCVALVDRRVHELYGEPLAAYFAHHGIALEALVYRATEAEKGLGTVERMLGDFKRLGISRNEPVLIVGGGVLADTGGLACALYGRGTPYVMLATSIVSGIDAGPSPRTCCDGFGYKNLLGAYHPPTTFFVDRFFFGTLRAGWLRHGVAEIVKIAAVRDAALFADLETARGRLIETRFGTIDCAPDDPMQGLARRILGRALAAYVASEFGNLYETHQCRPHAFGHTWSPGFEIAAGLLHGHAVAIDMGFGAYVALEKGLLDRANFDRLMRVMDGYGLSLWHDALDDDAVLWEAHRKIIQKRGGNLVAPVPSGEIGACGYVNDLTRAELFAARDAYRAICAAYPRGGVGVEPLCRDVGLEEPAVVGT